MVLGFLNRIFLLYSSLANTQSLSNHVKILWGQSVTKEIHIYTQYCFSVIGEQKLAYQTTKQ